MNQKEKQHRLGSPLNMAPIPKLTNLVHRHRSSITSRLAIPRMAEGNIREGESGSHTTHCLLITCRGYLIFQHSTCF
ncbi:hypothetical protein E1A91_D12G008900v1 [Gossypium mustelinum]|uniref:Uncharacterized protein n=1 Tax=Gossypium mustelinum TaxID=34275 RepID=A0A5D2S854_GOSMU|nr:hypothetical protein E1A91_D12G008900v1 [Gossypium mustelinum]